MGLISLVKHVENEKKYCTVDDYIGNIGFKDS